MHSAGRSSSSLMMEPTHSVESPVRPPSTSAFSPEFRFLLTCCTWPNTAARAEQISRALQTDLDWRRVVQLEERHRVTGLVHDALSRLPKDAVPEPVNRSIAEKAAVLARENLLLASESVRIARLLENAGIPVAFLKGVPLAMAVYHGLGLRHSEDIDLLVSEEAVVCACRTLTDAGYRGATPAEQMTTDAQFKRWFRSNRHVRYVHQTSGALIELHVRMFDNPLLNQVFGPECWEPVPVGGTTLVSLRRRELLLYLCLHGAMHGWFRLKWLADIGALLAQATESDIQQQLRAAQDSGIALPVVQAMQLSSILLGTAPVQRSTAPGWRERLLTHIALREMSCESAPKALTFRSARLNLSHYLLRSDWPYLLVQIRCDSTTAGDRELLPLPDAFSFLYAVFRPLLWIVRRLLAVWKG